MEKRAIRHFVVAITGASGSIYGLRLVHELLNADQRVTLLTTNAGHQVICHETGLDWAEEIEVRRRQVQEHYNSIAIDCLAHDDFMAGMASGSAAPDAMIVAPCSMGTLGRLAAGLSGTLLERAADVMLKERRPLVLVPRETPLSTLHLENMLRLSRAGAVILPAMPGFYHAPEHVIDLVDFVVGKILDQLNLPHELFTRWGQAPSEEA